MPLKINISHWEEKRLTLKGELTQEELEWDLRDEVIRVAQPLHYELEVQKMEQSLLIQGTLSQSLDCECVRCLKTFHPEVQIQDWSCLLPLEGDDQAEVINDCVDLTPYVREDILLAFPQHPLCSPQCKGLTKPGKNEQSDVGHADGESSVWGPLDKLKF